MEVAKDYRFAIDAYSPDTLPMSDLARLLGNTKRVHFRCLEAGSTVMVHRVEPEAAQEVNDRIRGLVDNTAAEEVKKAY